MPLRRTEPTFTGSASASSAHESVVAPTLCESGKIRDKRRLSSFIIKRQDTNLNRPSTTYYRERSGTRKRARTVSEICDNIKHDHRYENNPRSSTNALQRVRKALRNSQVRVKVLTERVKRLNIRVSCLKNVIIDLKKN